MENKSAVYTRKYFLEHEFSYINENREDIKRILTLLNLNKKDKVLEIGCGLGVLLSKIPSKNKIGIEISDFAIKVCRQKKLSVIKKDVDRGIPFKNSSFDVIIMNEVISHLKNPKFVLKECKRILKNNGRLLITSPVRNIFFHNISPTHLYEFSIKELKELIEKEGFQVLNHEVCGISFLHPIMENLFFRPFRFLRKILNKKRKGRSVDNFHKFADKTILKPMGTYRKFLLSLGTNQLILAKKIKII